MSSSEAQKTSREFEWKNYPTGLDGISCLSLMEIKELTR